MSHQHSHRIAAAMRQYQDHAEWEIQRWAYNYSVLPPSHKALLSHLPCKFAAAQQAAQTNTHFFKVCWCINTIVITMHVYSMHSIHARGVHLIHPCHPSHPPKHPTLSTTITLLNTTQALLSIYHEDNHSVAPHLAIANAAADEWQEHTPRANGTDMEKVR